MRKVYLSIILLLSVCILQAQYTPSVITRCSGTSFSFSDFATFGATQNYIWLPPTSTGFVTGGLASVSPTNVSVTQTLVNPGATGVTVSYTVTETSSNTVFTLTVVVNPIPSITSGISNQDILNGTSTANINFGGPVAGTTFTWTNSNPSIGLGASGVSGNIAPFVGTNSTQSIATANFTVVPSANGCPGSTSNFRIRVHPTTLVNCSNTTINYSNSTVFSLSPKYTWTAPIVTGGMTGGTTNLIGNPTIPDILVNPTTTQQTATYSVTETSSGTSFTLVFIINPTPSVNALTSQLLCNGALTTAINFAGSGVTNTTYSWTNNASIGLAGSGTGNIAAFAATNSGTAPVTATVIVTPISNTCNGSTQTFTIVVNPTPILSSSLTPTGICNTSSFSYTGTTLTSGTVFSWSRAAVAGVSSDTYGPFASGTVAGNTVATETFTNSNTSAQNLVFVFSMTANGCNNNQNVTLVVNPTPGFTSTLTPADICNSTIFGYTATSLTAPISFSWSRPAVTGISSPAPASGTGNISQLLTNSTNAPVPVTYLYTVSTNGCANSTVFTVTFNVNPSASLTGTLTPSAICSSTNFTYIANSSTNLTTTTYAWSRAAVSGINNGVASSGSGTTISQLLTNANIATTGVVYAFTLTAYGCSNNQLVTVNVYPVPVLNSSNPLPVCSGTAFSYSPSNSLAGTSFNWVRILVTGISNPAASGTNDPAETLVNTSSLPVTVNYAYTLITTAGCTNTQNIPLTVNPKPVLSSSLQAPGICTGNLFSYSPLSNTPGTLFSWTRAVAAPVTNGASLGLYDPGEYLVNPTINPGTVTYSYTLSANGCSNTQAVTVAVNPIPSVLPQTTATCSNLAFSVTPANVPSATVYTWSAPVISPVGSAIGGSAQATAQSIISQTLNNQTINTGTALYLVTPTASGCAGTPFSITVTINPVPFVASQLLTAVCSGSAFSFTASTVPVGTVYSWNNPIQSPLSSLTGTGPQPVNQPVVSQTLTSNNKIIDTAFYTVVPATAFCIGNAFSVTVPVKPLPVIIDLRDTICSGSAFFLSPSSGINNTTFTWGAPVSTPSGSVSGGFAQTLPVSSISQTLINTTSSVAQAVYTIVPSVANCAGPSFTLIETVSRPIPSFGNQPVLICSGTPFNATPANAPSGTTYTWTIPTSNPSGGVTGVSATSSPQTTVSQTLSNVLSVTDTVIYTIMPFLNNCQGPSFTATVSVAPIPRAIISGASTAVCQNPLPDTLSIKLIGTAPWSFTYSDSVSTQTKTGITSSPYSLILPVYPAALSKRTITITNVKDYACLNTTTDTSTLLQKINPLPVVQIVSLHGTYLCDGVKDTLFAKAPGGILYQWKINGTAAGGLTTDSITTLAAGTYNATVTNQFGCSDTAALPTNLIVAVQPTLRFSIDTSCIKSISHFTNLTDTTLTGSIQWLWVFGNGDSATTLNGKTSFNTAGNYHVKLKASQVFCPAYQPTLLDSIINISFPIPDTILASVSTYKSTITPVAGRSFPGYKYQWVPSLGIQNPDSISTNFNYASSQQYTIQLISPAGCVTSDSLLVRVFDDKLVEIFVPKSFTPNGDGVNDILYPYLSGIKQFHFFRVVDRYGKLLFETRNPDSGWNGSVNGTPQPMSVYFWMSEGTAADGSIVQKTGQVLLIR